MNAKVSLPDPSQFPLTDMATDLTWVDMLKGIAIIGVFLDNWIGYMKLTTSPELLYSFMSVFKLGVGPFVQVFFILSGFGLTLTYLQRDKTRWSWRKWAWRRFTKIVIPYQIFVLFSFALGLLGSYLYERINLQFSWLSLLTYITFTRNFYPPSWIWNPPLWFMPVIIGLYICFPVLVKILEKGGPWALILTAVLVTYGTLLIAVLIGASGDHEADWFTFWLTQFAVGMLMAYLKITQPSKLNLMKGVRAFVLGVGLMLCSWALRTYIPLGQVFNDSITSLGIFLILLNLGWAICLTNPAARRGLTALSRQSYFMYLIHYPIMLFLIGPLVRKPTNPLIVLLQAFIFIVVIFYLCRFISGPINKLTSRLYHNF